MLSEILTEHEISGRILQVVEWKNAEPDLHCVWKEHYLLFK